MIDYTALGRGDATGAAVAEIMALATPRQGGIALESGPPSDLRAPDGPADDPDGPDAWYWAILAEPIPDTDPECS